MILLRLQLRFMRHAPCPPEAAMLLVMVQVSDENFFLMSDGGYCRHERFIKFLAQVKPSCSGGVPQVESFTGDFAIVMENLQWLLNEASTPGFTEKHSIVTRPSNVIHIKARHVLFKVSFCYFIWKRLLTYLVIFLLTKVRFYNQRQDEW